MLPVLKPFQNTTKRAANSAGNRLTEFEGIHLSYDGAGNLSEKKLPDGTHLHFGYDALNRMVSLERHNPDGSTLRARYAYDVFNRRIRKSVSQGQNTTPCVTRYGWDGERMCAEVMDGLTRTTIYEPGSHVPLLRIDQEEQTPEPVPNLDLAPGVQRLFAPLRPKPPARIAHYHTDQLGTPLMLTGPEGKVLWRASPDDWAAVCDEKGETDQPIRFQGQQLDKESGLHYNFNRYYDPQMGRYVTQDPIGLKGGVNTYSYVNGDPLSKTDPMGLKDYFDQCVGRYAWCKSSQNPNGSTIENWLRIKGCKEATNIACKNEPKVCCDADRKDCNDAAKNEIEVAKCDAKYTGCMFRAGR